MTDDITKIYIEIRPTYESFLDSAIHRYEYLFPNHEINFENMAVCISSNEPFSKEEARQNFHHLLYREKIYADTLDIRKSIFKAIAHE